MLLVVAVGALGAVGQALVSPLAPAQQPLAIAVPAASGATRTIEFETTQVTQADVTLSPDDSWLAFTMLGHLFRLAVAGGTAEQLTFGPYYDSDPVFSPDGTRIAFVSDRESSDRNVFVLEMATGLITQVTREPWADRPVWSPDGRAIVYLSPVGEPRRLAPWLNLLPALVRRTPLGGGEAETLSAPRRLIPSVFYLRDGRLAWIVIESPQAASSRANARVEVLGADGTPSELQTFEGFPDRVVASPAGDGLYCRCYASFGTIRTIPTTEHLLFLPLRQGVKREIVPLSRVVWPDNTWYMREPLGFAPTSNGKNVYVGDAGRIWRIEVTSGVREPVPFTARVKLDVQDPVRPRKPALALSGTSQAPRAIHHPRLSPDGQTVVFGAAGYLWQQPLGAGPARRISDGNAFERDPAVSPDGRQLAFVRVVNGREEIGVFNFESRQARTIATGQSWGVSWSHDSRQLAFVETDDAGDRTVTLTIADGKKETIAEGSTWSRPHFSADGQWLYLSGTAQDGQLYRVRVAERTKPEPITRLDRFLRDGLVSPNGRWLAFRRNAAIWVAPLGDLPVEEEDVQLFSAEGAEGYAFSPDGSALIYSVGNRVWRHPLAGGAREEIAVHLELEHRTSPPLLIRRVRVLDYAAGGFSPEQSVFVEQGRIRWIGAERGKDIPRDAVIIEAAGRFAIPGLFDMHTHVGRPGPALDALIAYGVTSVRDLGSSLYWWGAVADHLEFSAEPGPRAFYAGENFNTVADSNVSSRVAVRDGADARSYVREWKAQGAYLIKPYSSLSWRLRRAIAEEARRQGLPVAGHGMSVEEITKSVTIGVGSLEHFNRHTRAYDDILLMLKAAGTRWDPTLEAPWGNDLLLRNEPERLYDPKLRVLMPESSLRDAQTVLDGPVNHSMLRGLWVDWLASVQRAHRLGVKLLAGSDTTGGRIFPGISLHWELEHLVEARVPPLDVLRIATEHAAETVGAEDDLGTLDVGKLADIVLLDKNPLENMKNTQTIWRVLKGGWPFDPDKLWPPASPSASK
jgi:imidazolonepropionase-like amidohydrolase/Tol biopolymer transport system component